MNHFIESTIKAAALRLLTILPAFALIASPASAAQKPNVIVILLDDLGYADVGFQNLPASSQVVTPNIDKLAGSGLIFKNGYVAMPVCGPSRASIMTGRSSSRFGIESNRGTMSKNEIIIPRAMGGTGYATAAFGKWHVGGDIPGTDPVGRGFDYYYGHVKGGGKDYFMDIVEDPPCWQDGSKSPREYGRYVTDAVTDQTVTFIEENKDQPFFAYVAYGAPHSPFKTTRQLLERVVKARPEWAPIYDRMLNGEGRWTGDRYNYGNFRRDDMGPEDEPVIRLAYISMLLAADDGVGDILKTLDKHDLRKNTLIFFLSDNGAALSRPVDLGGVNLPLRGGKDAVHDGGIRVPYVMSWPGVIQPGVDETTVVSSLDIFTTTVELAGGQLPQDRVIDGVNLIPYLTSKKKGQPHDALFFRRARMGSLRIGDYKYVIRPESNGEWLYNVKDDIAESNDLSGNLPEKIKEFSELFDSLTKDLPEYEGSRFNSDE
jgi:arylsulfatase A-like enzyme